MSEAPRNTTQSDILSRAKDHLWDIKTVYMLDSENIKAWLEREGKEKLSGIVGIRSEEATQVIQKAKNHYKSLSIELEGMYKIREMVVDPKLMQDAKDGILQRKASSGSVIILWLILLLMAACTELSFFGYLVFFKGAGGGVLGVAISLLLGGILAGYGISCMIEHSKIAEEEKKGTEYKIENKYIFWLAVGILLFVGSTVFRWVYGGTLAGIVAAFFGSALMTTETIFSFNKWSRKYYMQRMFKAQQYYAVVQLRNDLKDEITHIDDTWRTFYECYIESATTVVRDITSPSV